VEDKTGWRKRLSIGATGARFALLIALPGVVGLFSGFAGMNHGTVRTNLIYASVLSAVLLAGLNVLKDSQARKATTSAAELALSLHYSTQPLLTLLSRVAEAKTTEDRRANVHALIARIVAIAHAQSGHFAAKDCKKRAVYYHFVDDDHLVYQYSEGRNDPKPRNDFVVRDGRSRTDDNDRKVVELAQGDSSVLIKNVDKAPPAYFSDYEGRPYKTFLMVPVRTEKRSFGFLSVDADKPDTLASLDVEYVIVLARILATALAQLPGDHPQISSDYATPNQRTASAQAAKEGN
jgi:hypothetical protein